MLSEILSRETCADCKVCCSFDADDIWEAPVIDNILRDKVLEIYSNQKFIPKYNSYLFQMDKPDDQDLFYCPMLTTKGCILNDEKPFDCKIWPFRIMNFGNHRVIALSPVCSNVFNKPINELIDFLNKGLAKTIFYQADKNPDIIKDYIDGYPILVVE